jgi:DNA-binding transcriptional LysR family regulator
VIPDSGLELRRLRTFVAVAERGSFSRAADDLHIAQQAVSQQIKALESSLGVSLLRRTPRHVDLTPEGAVLVADARRLLAAADRTAQRVRAAARGELGTLRLAYTLTTVWDTFPRLLASLAEAHPKLKIEGREVLGADIPELLMSARCDVAVAPVTSYTKGFHSQTLRHEPLVIALSDKEPLARRKRLELTTLADRVFEVWPREMAPGFYDAVVGTCRREGFEPTLDEQATGNIVWRNLAAGRGVALINASLTEQLPRGVALVQLAESSTITFEAIWHQDRHPLIERMLETAAELAAKAGWL